MEAHVKKCIKRLSVGQPISTEDVVQSLEAMMQGVVSDAQIGAFLLALGEQGKEPAVVKACADVLLKFAVPCKVNGSPVIDIVGTGGDGKDAFNVSTAAGIVLAATGVVVAKHGNRSSSGNCGSADFLEALGVNINLASSSVTSVIDACGFCFLFAQKFHPAMKNVAVARKSIGIRTVFNLLGPLTNPTQPKRQVIGVGSRDLAPLFAELFRTKKSEHALIVHSTDGLDEISPEAPTDVWEVKDGKIIQYQITPEDFGLSPAPLADVIGGSAAVRAERFHKFLDGEEGSLRTFIAVNAAAGLYVSGLAPTLADATKKVLEAVDSGKAKEVLAKYISESQKPEHALTNDNQSVVTVEPMQTYETAGGVQVTRSTKTAKAAEQIEAIADALDQNLGVLLTSSYEYPGRYTRWDIGFINPPIVVTGSSYQFKVEALNRRGNVLVPAIHAALEAVDVINVNTKEATEDGLDHFTGTIQKSSEFFCEEDRSRQPSLFTVVRTIIQLFFSPEDASLGLYGAFGYDLCFQFEDIKQRMERDDNQRDVVLFIPDSIVQVDHTKTDATIVNYEFAYNDSSTVGLPREGKVHPFEAASKPLECKEDHAPGQYADKVRAARQKFKSGDLFETVLSQCFYEECAAAPSELFRRLRDRNPAPYGFLINLGNKEFLVGASPEMYVRVQGDRVETCPISGTIKRGKDAIDDSKQILELLNSKKEESELTMCTDVDRNDKSRICRPGSVRVIARRQIEMYSRLIHTVDHVEGYLREEFDALDAFLCHAWAVTVTGAPKAWAMQFVEDQEASPRAWYAGAIGLLNFNGDMNTGLTLRTIRILDGIASVRAGATLLWDSDPDAEEAETRLKASAFLDALRNPRSNIAASHTSHHYTSVGVGVKVVLIDHQDSFVHTLGNYLRQTGAEVLTLRAGFRAYELDKFQPDMAVMSPGPGTPKDFDTNGTIAMLLERNLPIFGVCLGLQAMVEFYGGELDTLGEPIHGKPGTITTQGDGGSLFFGMPQEFTAARYHSIYAKTPLPEELRVTALSQDGLVMAVQHKTLPLAAVQFHPESILTAHADGLQIIENFLKIYIHSKRKNPSTPDKAKQETTI